MDDLEKRIRAAVPLSSPRDAPLSPRHEHELALLKAQIQQNTNLPKNATHGANRRYASHKSFPQGHHKTPATTRYRGRWIASGLAAGGVVLLNAIGLWPSATSVAFASWTPAPNQITEAQLTDLAANCPSEFPDPDPGIRTLPLTLADVRGTYSFIIRADNELYIQCYIQTDPDTGKIISSISQAGTINLTANNGISTQSNSVTTWGALSDRHGAIALAFGRLEPEVSAVNVKLNDGRKITATVENGWWAMWVPGTETLPEQAELTLKDGTTLTAKINQE